MPDPPEHESSAFADPDALGDSAREWHKLQLAALAFVGLCGVLTGDNGTRLPLWLQSVAGILAVLALVAAAIGVLLVALVAWPLGAPGPPTDRAHRLRLGVVFTCFAVGLTATSASSNWWPQFRATRPVLVSTSSGTVCGQVVASADGWIDLEVGGRVVRVNLADLVSLRPADSC